MPIKMVGRNVVINVVNILINAENMNILSALALRKSKRPYLMGSDINLFL